VRAARARFAAGAAALIIAFGCTPAEEQPRDSATEPPVPARGGSVVFGVVGAPATLDPYSQQATDLTYALVRPLYPSLYRFRPDGSTEPYLARSAARVGPDLVVTLRRARWTNGRPITALDVVSSARRAGPASGFSAFDRIRVAGRHRVALRGRVAEPERALATLGFVLPSGIAGRATGGPYRMRSHTRGLEIVYAAARRPRGTTPYLDSVTVRFVQSQGQLLSLLEAGRVDAAAPLSTVNLGETLKDGVSLSGVLGWERVVLDFAGSQLSRAQRAAVAGSIDRRQIETVFVRSAGRVTDSVAPGPGPAGATGPWPAALGARRSLPGPVDLSAPAGDELLELIRRAAFTQISGAGIEVNALTIDSQTFYATWNVGEDTDVAIRRQAGAPPWRRPLERVKDLGVFPLVHVETFVAWRSGLRGLAPNPTVEGPLWNMEHWWSEPPDGA
jgi:ABC-type transport system substrate-binding protein